MLQNYLKTDIKWDAMRQSGYSMYIASGQSDLKVLQQYRLGWGSLARREGRGEKS